MVVEGSIPWNLAITGQDPTDLAPLRDPNEPDHGCCEGPPEHSCRQERSDRRANQRSARNSHRRRNSY